MVRAKEQYLLWLEAQARLEDASYEEAQSRLCMSTLCKACVRKLDYPLPARMAAPCEALVAPEADLGPPGGRILTHGGPFWTPGRRFSPLASPFLT